MKKLIVICLAMSFVISLQAQGVRGTNKSGSINSSKFNSNSQNLYIMGSAVDYDAVLVKENAMPARSSYRTNRNLADTLAYVPADGSWNGQFTQEPGDAMMVMFKMPADGIIKGVNVPVYEWGTGDQEMTISLHKVTYPETSDGAA